MLDVSLFRILIPFIGVAEDDLGDPRVEVSLDIAAERAGGEEDLVEEAGGEVPCDGLWSSVTGAGREHGTGAFDGTG